MTLDALLRPKSIAIIGVSRDTSKQSTINGSAILESLTRFQYPGRIDLIHPEAKEIGGRQVYPSISALPEVPDLIVLSLAAGKVPQAVAESGARGIRAAVVMSAGFSELGAGEGTDLETQMEDHANKHGVRICGPNGLGYINVPDGIYAGYYPCLSTASPKAGGLAIISHSGAVGNSLVARAIDRGAGFSYVISAGNETNVALADYIDYVIGDPNTKVISIYMEGVVDGVGLRRALGRARDAGKPVVVFKVGQSSAGARAALSHTAKIAGEPALYRGMFRQLGVIEAKSLDDLIEIPMVLTKARTAPKAIPRNIGVVTISGGLGAIMADHFSAEGFELPELSSATQAKLAELPLKFGSTVNPVDTTAAIQRTESTLADIITIVAGDPAVDAVVFPNASRFPQRALDVAKIMSDTAETLEKPLLSVWYAGSDNDPAMRLLHDSRSVACFDDSAACARALAALREHRANSVRTATAPEAAPAGAREALFGRTPNPGLLSEPAAKAVLQSYGVPIPQEFVAASANQAVEFAARVGFPVALKIASAGIPHKAAVGGVILNLANEEDVREAYDKIVTSVSRNAPAATVEGVLVSPMVPIRLELIVGACVDPSLGASLLIGMGGSDVENLRDVAMCLLPVTPEDCRQMLEDLKDRRVKLLVEADKAALVEAISRIGVMAWDLQPRLSELDINPLVLASSGKVVALDAVMTFADAPVTAK